MYITCCDQLIVSKEIHRSNWRYISQEFKLTAQVIVSPWDQQRICCLLNAWLHKQIFNGQKRRITLAVCLASWSTTGSSDLHNFAFPLYVLRLSVPDLITMSASGEKYINQFDDPRQFYIPFMSTNWAPSSLWISDVHMSWTPLFWACTQERDSSNILLPLHSDDCTVNTWRMYTFCCPWRFNSNWRGWPPMFGLRPISAI